MWVSWRLDPVGSGGWTRAHPGVHGTFPFGVDDGPRNLRRFAYSIVQDARRCGQGRSNFLRGRAKCLIVGVGGDPMDRMDPLGAIAYAGRGWGHHLGCEAPSLRTFRANGIIRRDGRKDADGTGRARPFTVHTMVDAVAPLVVVESIAECGDATPAHAALQRALGPGRAPRAGWTVTTTFRRGGSGLHASAEVRDDQGDLIASRALQARGSECRGLAQAVGVWAVLVLDAELDRDRERSPVLPPPAASAPSPTSTDVVAWPAPANPTPAPSSDSSLFLEHPPGSRSLEIGGGGFVASGLGVGTLAGPAAFGVVEVGRGWFLRPLVGVGRSIGRVGPGSDVYATLGLTHLDACRRIPGNYLERRGIQLDLCGGSDLGFLMIDPPSLPEGTDRRTPGLSGRTLPIFDVGPALALRGELGSDLSVDLRGFAGLNVARGHFVDGNGVEVQPSWITARAELGLTWRLR